MIQPVNTAEAMALTIYVKACTKNIAERQYSPALFGSLKRAAQQAAAIYFDQEEPVAPDAESATTAAHAIQKTRDFDSHKIKQGRQQ